MSWKNVKRSETKTNSLVFKLMVLYIVSTISIVAMVCFVLFPTFETVTHFPHAAPTHHKLFGECMVQLTFAIILSLLSALAFGNIIARYVMNTIQTFSNSIEKITVNSLSEKLNMIHIPKELKLLAESFNTMLARLEKAYGQLTQFSADISHELRNSIHNLRMTTEVALSKQNTSAEYRHLLECNIEEYQHLSRLIENLLFLARSDHGEIRLNKKLLSVRDEILKAVAYHQALADENNISIHCNGDAQLLCDATLFKRAIHNLLSNALKFTAASESIEITITANQNAVRITVKDKGVGIASDHLAKVCERFYRVDRSVQTGGLGLGLAIVKSIVELHQGKIFIASELHIGTSVTLEFPI